MRVFTRRKVYLPLIAAVVALGITAAVALANTDLASHTGEVGATWTKHTSYSTGGAEVVTSTGRLRPNTSTALTTYYASGSPTNANYTVEADVVPVTQPGGGIAGVAGRIDTSANTMYRCYYYQPSGQWELQKIVAGTTTLLANRVQTLTNGTSYHALLSMNSTTISCTAGGSSVGSVTDSSITAAGKAGVYLRHIWTSGSPTDSTSYQLDNFVATDL